METALKTKKSSHSKTAKPFFRKNDEGSFFLNSGQAKPAFFRPTAIQAKLSIGQPGDKYEQEADQVAEQVVNTPVQSKRIASNITPLSSSFAQSKQTTNSIKGQSSQSQPKASNQLESKINSGKGGGSPLDQSTQSEMSQKMGADFSRVRVHTGSQSVQMNRELGAKAFTVGNDIHFNQGKYSPGNREGKRLLAHELTHIVQQSAFQHRVQRAPGEGGTAAMHEELTRQYSEATGIPYREGLQYTDGYHQWLADQNGAEASQHSPQQASSPSSTATIHEELTRQYSQAANIPYREGLQYTEGYRQWLAEQSGTQTPPSSDRENGSPDKPTGVEEKKDKIKTDVSAGVGVKDGSGTANASANLKVPLGSAQSDYWKLALKTGLFLKWESALSGPAKEKLDAGMKLQFDYLDLLMNSKDFSLTSGLFLAGSGGFKTEDDKTKPFGSMQVGVTGRFIYVGDMWEANLYATGGFSMFGVDGEPLVPGGFLHSGASVYLRGNIGDEQHKVLLGPVLEGGYNLDSSQDKSEGFLNLNLMLRW